MANNNLITSAVLEADVLEAPFTTDKERINYMKKVYGNMNIAECFSKFYGIDVDEKLKNSRALNTFTTIELGKTYLCTVKEINSRHIIFYMPGCKEELECKENFSDCLDNINEYLSQHDNKLLFEVREKKQGRYIVSVIEAYYKKWQKDINDSIKYERPVIVHIDSLVKGGYVCHTTITTLQELTGRTYTHSVFIPGSHIVLNIEHDFDKWIGQDEPIIPQKFVEYHRNMVTGQVENSLVGSRKRVLQMIGSSKLDLLYQKHQLVEKTNSQLPSYEGTVTGIIRSAKKMGVFVELNGMYITGLMPVDSPEDLLDYKVGNTVNVKVNKFEIQDGKEPFIYNRKGVVIHSNCRPVFMPC